MEIRVAYDESALIDAIAVNAMANICYGDLASEIDLRDLADHLADSIDVRDVAEYVDIDWDDVVERVDLDEVAREVVRNREFWKSVIDHVQNDDGFFDQFVDELIKSKRFDHVRVQVRDEMTVWFYEHIAPELPKSWRKKLSKSVGRKIKKVKESK